MKVIYKLDMKCWYSIHERIDNYHYECKSIQDIVSKVISTLEEYPNWKSKLSPSVTKHMLRYVQGEGFQIVSTNNINLLNLFREALTDKLNYQFQKSIDEQYIINDLHEPCAKVAFDYNLNICDAEVSCIKLTVTCSVKEDE